MNIDETKICIYRQLLTYIWISIRYLSLEQFENPFPIMQAEKRTRLVSARSPARVHSIVKYAKSEIATA